MRDQCRAIIVLQEHKRWKKLVGRLMPAVNHSEYKIATDLGYIIQINFHVPPANTCIEWLIAEMLE